MSVDETSTGKTRIVAPARSVRSMCLRQIPPASSRAGCTTQERAILSVPSGHGGEESVSPVEVGAGAPEIAAPDPLAVTADAAWAATGSSGATASASSRGGADASSSKATAVEAACVVGRPGDSLQAGAPSRAITARNKEERRIEEPATRFGGAGSPVRYPSCQNASSRGGGSGAPDGEGSVLARRKAEQIQRFTKNRPPPSFFSEFFPRSRR